MITISNFKLSNCPASYVFGLTLHKPKVVWESLRFHVNLANGCHLRWEFLLFDLVRVRLEERDTRVQDDTSNDDYHAHLRLRRQNRPEKNDTKDNRQHLKVQKGKRAATGARKPDVVLACFVIPPTFIASGEVLLLATNDTILRKYAPSPFTMSARSTPDPGSRSAMLSILSWSVPVYLDSKTRHEARNHTARGLIPTHTILTLRPQKEQ